VEANIGRVLIVDDERGIREVFKAVLEEAGYAVVTAPNGEQALAEVSNCDFDAILLDVRMPGVSGLEVLKQIRAKHPDVSVLMISGVGEIEIAVEAMKSGAYDYVAKPCNPTELSQRVERAIELRRMALQIQEAELRTQQTLENQKEQLHLQFAELVKGLAREHALALDVVELQGHKRSQGMLASLPSEFKKPKTSVNEFVQALLRLVRDEGQMHV